MRRDRRALVVPCVDRDDQEVDRQREHEDAEHEQVEEPVVARSGPVALETSVNDEATDQREPGVGDKVVEQAGPGVAPAHPADDDRGDADQQPRACRRGRPSRAPATGSCPRSSPQPTVVAAEMSLTIEKTSSEASRARSQFALSASSTATATAPASAAISNRTTNGPGRRRPCRGGPPGERLPETPIGQRAGFA